jgi:hypothetical protein
VAEWLDTSTPAPKTRPSSGQTTGKVAVGRTILLARRTKTSRCALGSNPDRRCSPGAYYSKLGKATICSPSFRTSTIRNVPDSERFAVEREYGIKPGHYGSTLEIDHIVPLELGGSNDIANLFPEQLYVRPGYRIKDKLENKLHALVCAGSMTLRSVRVRISTDWQALYERVYGVSPSG